MNKPRRIHIYTGNGKGKTTAAFGLAFRACGQGLRVCIIQFLKGNCDYGEIYSSRLHDNLEVFQFGRKEFVTADHLVAADYEEAGKGIELAGALLANERHDLLVLDEINVAVHFGLITVDEVLALIRMKSRVELVLTGRNARPELVEQADLVTEMKEIKHYFNNGVKARKGIEF